MATSRKSRSRKLPPRPKKGALNYTTKSSRATRQKNLSKNVKKQGYKTTIAELNLRAVVNKNQSPTAAAKMRKDMKYLKRKYGSKKSR